MLKPVSSEALGRPRAVSNYFLGPPDRPRPLQELSKSSPRPLQEAFSRPRSSKRPLGSNLTPIWIPFWIPFGRKNHFHEVFRRQSAAIADIVEETTHSTITSNYLRGLSSGSWGGTSVVVSWRVLEVLETSWSDLGGHWSRRREVVWRATGPAQEHFQDRS